jgi:hypothetical protein
MILADFHLPPLPAWQRTSGPRNNDLSRAAAIQQLAFSPRSLAAAAPTQTHSLPMLAFALRVFTFFLGFIYPA